MGLFYVYRFWIYLCIIRFMLFFGLIMGNNKGRCYDGEWWEDYDLFFYGIFILDMKIYVFGYLIIVIN